MILDFVFCFTLFYFFFLRFKSVMQNLLLDHLDLAFSKLDVKYPQ